MDALVASITVVEEAQVLPVAHRPYTICFPDSSLTLSPTTLMYVHVHFMQTTGLFDVP